MNVEKVSENKCYNGIQGVYTHSSASLSCDVILGLFLPQLAQSEKVPLLWFYLVLPARMKMRWSKLGRAA